MVLSKEKGEIKLREEIEEKLAGEREVLQTVDLEDTSMTEFLAKDKEENGPKAYRWGIYDKENQKDVKWIPDTNYSAVIKRDLDTFENQGEVKLPPLQIARGLAGLDSDHRKEILDLIEETIDEYEKEEEVEEATEGVSPIDTSNSA